jgi:hypothetical protein
MTYIPSICKKISLPFYNCLIMKRFLLLFSLFFLFLFNFQGHVPAGYSVSPGNIVDAHESMLTDTVITIDFIKNGSIIGAKLPGVTVKRIRGGNADLSQIYYNKPINVPVQPNDEIEFTNANWETVRIKVNHIIGIKGIGIFMFEHNPTGQAEESIEGTVFDKSGNKWINFPVTVNTDSTRTDSVGIYKVKLKAATSFTIKYNHKTTGRLIGVLTVNTADDGGRVVIDVAFDEDVTKDDH